MCGVRVLCVDQAACLGAPTRGLGARIAQLDLVLERGLDELDDELASALLDKEGLVAAQLAGEVVRVHAGDEAAQGSALLAAGEEVVVEGAPLVLHPGAHDVVCAGAHHHHDSGGVECLVDGVLVGALAHLGEAQGAAEGPDALFL